MGTRNIGGKTVKSKQTKENDGGDDPELMSPETHGRPTQVGGPTIVSKHSGHYHGWPTLAKAGNSLLAVCSGFRAQHICPFGKLVFFRSNDGGETWGEPRVLHDSVIDDRDAGVLVTQSGTILVTWFTSMVWKEQLEAFRKHGPLAEHSPINPESWRTKEIESTKEIVEAELGAWSVRSSDQGITWSSPINTIVNSPHGPTQLADGSLLYVGKCMKNGESCLAVRSDDDGITWRVVGEIPERPGDRAAMYHEFHAVQAADGKIVAQIRNHNPANQWETLQCESLDGGCTWTPPRPIGVWGYPSHLLRLSDGRLLMTYSCRKGKGSIEARLSADHGDHWSLPLVIVDSTPTMDMGYPSTVELEPEKFGTLWYQEPKPGEAAILCFLNWNL